MRIVAIVVLKKFSLDGGWLSRNKLIFMMTQLPISDALKLCMNCQFVHVTQAFAQFRDCARGSQINRME